MSRTKVTIESILESGEHLTWRGKIDRRAIVVQSILLLTITLTIALILFSKPSISYQSNGVPKQTSGQTAGSIVLGTGLFFTVFGFVSRWVQEYGLSVKRIIIKSGIIGTDFKSIPLDQIKNVEVTVGLLGKLLSLGTIKIDLGKTETYSTGNSNGHRNIRTRTMYDTLDYIEKPYEVHQRLQQMLNTRKESLYSGRADREAISSQ